MIGESVTTRSRARPVALVRRASHLRRTLRDENVDGAGVQRLRDDHEISRAALVVAEPGEAIE